VSTLIPRRFSSTSTRASRRIGVESATRCHGGWRSYVDWKCCGIGSAVLSRRLIPGGFAGERARICGVACGLGPFERIVPYLRERTVASEWREAPTGGNLGRGPARATFSDFCSENLEGPLLTLFDFPSSETGWLSCYTSLTGSAHRPYPAATAGSSGRGPWRS